MTRIILNGCSGKMGQAVSQCCAERDDVQIICGVDINITSQDYPVYSCFVDVKEDADVIIDFSNPLVLDDMLAFSKDRKLPVVVCTTGFSDSQIAQIKEASKEVPIFFSGNMSLGINTLISLAQKAARALSSSFDIEIIEKHHNLKLDAPSGTAVMIADAVSDCVDNARYVYDRHSVRKKRDKNEIGIHSLRGGNIVGEHEIVFAGHDEVLSIKHQAFSKGVFASGAVNAAVFLSNQDAGLYDMNDLLASV